MRALPELPKNFAGQLLVAHPNLRDPNFRRSVLFISAHEENEGTIGLIINRPLEKNVAELATDNTPKIFADVPVFLGGPVGTNQLTFAAFHWLESGSVTLEQQVGFDVVPPGAEENQREIRAFVGYAGWSAGQLENELRQNAWLLHKPERAAFSAERLPRLWFEIMRGLGPWFKLLAAAPDDPGRN